MARCTWRLLAVNWVRRQLVLTVGRTGQLHAVPHLAATGVQGEVHGLAPGCGASSAQRIGRRVARGLQPDDRSHGGCREWQARTAR